MFVCHFNHRLVRDDTTDPGLQRLVVDTGGDVPDMRPIIGRHMLASFTLEHLGQRWDWWMLLIIVLL